MGKQNPTLYEPNAVTIDGAAKSTTVLHRGQPRRMLRENCALHGGHITEKTDVESRESDRSQSLPLVNYAAAIAKAIEWLGDRYLLAKPKELVHRRRSKLGCRNDPAPNL